MNQKPRIFLRFTRENCQNNSHQRTMGWNYKHNPTTKKQEQARERATQRNSHLNRAKPEHAKTEQRKQQNPTPHERHKAVTKEAIRQKRYSHNVDFGGHWWQSFLFRVPSKSATRRRKMGATRSVQWTCQGDLMEGERKWCSLFIVPSKQWG